jgi:eukaryotic-like serine/threonine-protein kinase
MNARCLHGRSGRAGPARPAGSTPDAAWSSLLAAGFIYPGRDAGLAARVDRYRVFATLGAGSMGIVLWGWDSFHARRVAIKFLRPELADLPGLADRFLVEAGFLERLRHPRIMPVIDISTRAACPYFVMPLLERGSLAREIARRTKLDSARALSWARQIAEALARVHGAGIIHRDVKPSNILIDEEGGLCLADFGLARLGPGRAGGQSHTKRREGTAVYMSPTLAAGGTEGAGGDIYAFGALVYEMLTGKPPYGGRTVSEVVRQVLAGPPVPLREANPNAPVRLAGIAEGAMARDRRDRYGSMRHVLADLDRVRCGQAPLGPARDEGGKRIPR